MSAVATARAAWGGALPDWLRVLAEQCDHVGSQAQVARRIGYSASTVNQVLAAKYRGDLRKVAAAVEGAFLAATVECPVLGQIATDKCLAHQRRPMAGTNPQRVRLWRACRGGCPHSRIGQPAGGPEPQAGG